jgi:hypothetical protein
MVNRRQLLLGAGAMAGAVAHSSRVLAATTEQEPEAGKHPLDSSEFMPNSMLQVHESHVERAKFPLIDITPTSPFRRNQKKA